MSAAAAAADALVRCTGCEARPDCNMPVKPPNTTCDSCSANILQVDYDNLEDPAFYWVKLVDAFRTRDPASVNRVLAVAKKSQWTGTLWKNEMEHMAMAEDSSTDEE